MRRNFSKISFFLTLALLFSLVTPFQFINAAETTKTITILGTSDIHNAIYPWDYKSGVADDDAGLAKVYTIVKEVRKENPNTILIDNGDTIQGTELSDVYKNDTSVTYPIIAVMNEMKYDAWTLGNHEFNYGLDVLNRIIGEAKFPVLSANIYKKADNSNFAKPYIVKEIDGVKVGILGMTTPNIPRWDGEKVKDLQFNSLIDEGKKWVKVLKEQEKVDLIIASIHAGVDGEYFEDGGDSVKAVAEQVPGIDAILAGHAHSDIEGQLINNVLISEPKSTGNKVSRFDISLENVNGEWKVTNKTAKNIDTKNVEAAQEILDLAKDYHQKTIDYVNTPIGEATGNFLPSSEMPAIPVAQIQDTALMDLINKVQLYYTDADVSLAALFTSKSDLKKGPISIKDVANIYKYENTLIKTEITGAQLKALMEKSAAYYNTYKPGDVTISFSPNIRMYNYDMFAGVNYQIDISKEPGKRIQNLTFKGKPVTDEMKLTLALNDYRYNGMKSLGLITGDKLIDTTTQGEEGQIRNLIAKYIKEKKTIAPEVDNNWKIVGADLNHWAKKDAYDLLNKKVIDIPVSEDGRTPNVASVNLEEKVTRGEFIKAIVKAKGLELPNVTTTKFTDVDAKLAPYVQAAFDAKITKGVAADRFGVNDVITREQAISLVMNSLHLSIKQDLNAFSQYKDLKEVSDWAKGNIAAALKVGLIQGTTSSTISPKMEFTRGHMVAIINHSLNVNLKQIDIFSTNDFHGNLEGGYEAGIAKLAAVYEEYKKQNPQGTLILDAGDRYQGTPLSNIFFGEPVAKAFEMIGYKAVTLGNHEFDWGIEKVLATRKEANVTFPLLAANIYDKATNKPVEWAKPYTIIEQNGVKIGIIGLATPETLETAKLEFIKNFDFKDPITVANQLVPEVRKDGAELVVLLTHVPGSQDPDTKEISGALADLANGVKDVDAIIGGHSHEAVQGIINGIPVVEASKNGRMMGHITIVFDQKNQKVIDRSAALVEVRKTALEVTPNKEIQAIVDKYNEDVKSIFDVVIGKTTVDLKPDYNNESNIGNWMADVMKEKVDAQIAFQNAGGIRTELPAGDITVGNIFTMMPFDNTIVKAEMTGAQIKAVLEQSVTLYKGMMQISGLKVKYDSTKPEYQRVTEITLEDGTPVEMDKTYTVATNDFLSGGQDGFKTLAEVTWTNTYELVRDALIEKIKNAKVIAPTVEDRMIDISKQVSMINYELLAA
ncbi:5'-nucleotidase C-terminal domain-containing protein [Tepidibacillus infernus]|uniref:5'-nucleotidase C-terminal domain-containing protein n=1 Tax=Tepidibacillus infernus TaxID=1806172 RepID=UPI003B69D407